MNMGFLQKAWMGVVVGALFIYSATAQVVLVRLEVKPVVSKKNTPWDNGNRLIHNESRSLNISVHNNTPQPILGVKVRWGIVKTQLAGKSNNLKASTSAFGKEETLDLKPLERKTFVTSAVEAQSKQFDRLATQGEKIVGHGVQLLINGSVVAEEFVPPSCKKPFETLQSPDPEPKPRGKRR